MSKKQKLSLIIPCYNEEKNIQFAYSEIIKTMKSMDVDYELVFVDDGSGDNTVLEIEQLQKQDKKVVLVEFARNFGKEMATSAGINNCTGDGCIIVDADMQYPIEKLPEFVEKWQAGAEVVIGMRDKKKTNNLIEKLGSYMFYKISNMISDVEIMAGALDFRLIDRVVIEEFKNFSERGRMTRALIDWLGFKRDYVQYQEKPRQFGEPAYSFVKRVKLALNTFVGTSLVPLRLAGYVGTFMTCVAIVLGITLMVMELGFDNPYGWDITAELSLGVFVSFLTGLVLSAIGLLAVYTGNIHTQILGRPMYVIRRKQVSSRDQVYVKYSDR